MPGLGLGLTRCRTALRLPLFPCHLQSLTSCLPKYISQYSVFKDELTVYTAPEDLLHVLRFLKDHSQCLYRALMDVTAVDYPTRWVHPFRDQACRRTCPAPAD